MKETFELDHTNSKIYTPLAEPKHAILEWNPQDYVLPSGLQTFDCPHIQIWPGKGEGETYGCELHTFYETHKAIPDQKDHYVKSVQVRAVQLTEKTKVVTILDGKEEAVFEAPAGSWLVRNPKGEQYVMEGPKFRRFYDVENPE